MISVAALPVPYFRTHEALIETLSTFRGQSDRVGDGEGGGVDAHEERVCVCVFGRTVSVSDVEYNEPSVKGWLAVLEKALV